MSERKRLLYIVHCYNNRAGVEEHIKVLSKHISKHYEVAIAYPEQGAVWLQRVNGERGGFSAKPLSIVAPFRSKEHEAALAQILQTYSPDLIHLVHFVYWPLSILQQLLAYGRPVVASFHDYYSITPHFTMQGVDDPKLTTTSEYATKFFGKDISNYLQDRQKYFKDSFSKFSKLIVPSNYLRSTLKQVFDLDFEIAPYGIEPFEVQKPKEAWNGIRFGYLGSLIPQKGCESLIQAFRKVREKYPEAELRIYGGIREAEPGISYFDTYEQSDIPRIVSEFDIGVIPSVFAETYSIVLSELWQAEKAVAVSDIGAMGERVKDGVNGKKFKPGNVEDIVKTLSWFCESDAWKSLKRDKPQNASQMVEQYLKIYRSVNE